MTMTNAGNKYKFEAIIKRRSNPHTVTLQRMRKNGVWGKATEYPKFGNETDEQAAERMTKLNGVQFRIAE